MKSAEIDKIAKALSACQADVKAAAEDKKNPHFRSQYSSLNSIWQACREALSKNGLSVSQLTSCDGDMLMLNTLLMHESGQWLMSTMPIISAKATPQAMGSSITYMRRYCLAAIVGVASGEDDDGNEAERHAAIRAKYPVIDEKPEGYDAFLRDFFDADKRIYLKKICKDTEKTEMQIVKLAMKKPESFLHSYEKWKAEQPKIAQEITTTGSGNLVELVEQCIDAMGV